MSIILLAFIVPNITGYTYTEQNIAFKNLPPKIPRLEKIGIADGTRMLTNRQKKNLDDPKRFPEGSVLEIVREYVLAARTLGVRDMRLIFRHILPNCIGPLITRAMIAIPGAIFSESFLAYIGLGIKPPNPSIGVLLSDG